MPSLILQVIPFYLFPPNQESFLSFIFLKNHLFPSAVSHFELLPDSSGNPDQLPVLSRDAIFSASVFGEQRRLQPMAPDQKSRWTKEIDWLLSVSDHIVEFVPSRQVAENGTCMEVRNSPYFSTCGYIQLHCPIRLYSTALNTSAIIALN